VTIILVVVCLALAAGLFYRHTQATQEKQRDVAQITYYSNKVTDVSTKFDEQKMVNMSLERDLVTQTEELKSYSNSLARVSNNLINVQAEAKAAAETAKSEVEKRDAKINELESERDDLTKKMGQLKTSMADLESQITDTQRRLDASEGDREFLLKELKRMQAEKADLERQFNDIAMLREQVRRLRDELSINRRLEWIRRGLYGNLMKGGEKLAKGFVPESPKTNYNLNVELNRDGSVRVLNAITNTPAAQNGSSAPANPAPAPATK
jgi:chromosome segregation ATPase